MPKDIVDTVENILIKFMDFLEFLATLSQDLKIEEVKILEKLIETLRKNIYYSLVVYNPVRFVGLNKLH